MCDAESQPFADPLVRLSSGGSVSPGAETASAGQIAQGEASGDEVYPPLGELLDLIEEQDGAAWSNPDAAGVRHYQGPPPPAATVLDAHTYIGPRIVPCTQSDGEWGLDIVSVLRVVCVCGWQSDPLDGILLADAAVLYGDHLLEVTDG